MTNQNFETNHNYLDYLSSLEDQGVNSHAAEDIYNKFGVLLVSKGQPINAKTAATLKLHQLTKPFDLQISLDNTKSNHDIYYDVVTEIEKYPHLHNIHLAKNLDKQLMAYVTQFLLPLSIRQKLSVMALKLPHVYKEGLVLFWFSGLLGQQLKYSFERTQALCFANLLHDIGFVYLPYELSLQNKLSDEQVAPMQSHVLLGKLILEMEHGFSVEIIQGVYEHHERTDRTGYPTRKPGSQISEFGQIINCLNLVYDIYMNEVISHGFPFAATIPFLKVHQGAYGQEILSTIINMIKGIKRDSSENISPEFITTTLPYVTQLNLKIRELAEIKEQLKSTILEFHKAGLETQLVINFIKLDDALRNSGLDKDEFETIIRQLKADDVDALEVFELYAMNQEVLWLYKRTAWNISDAIKNSNKLSKAQITQLNGYLEQLQALVEAAWLHIREFKTAVKELLVG